jgi:copper ion binding protein
LCIKPHRNEEIPACRARCAARIGRKEQFVASILEHVTVTAPDISCGHCVATVKNAVGALPGVASVEADETTKRVEIDFDPGRVSLAQIEAALDDAGYPVEK